ncbi:hypothetical protein DFH07DRAFT_772154 [Mycena maculata]|uniref:Uncharacterized protein n=1 Tax=Mycena maculata TaxID=230809 RepID=A0AAD7J867_9AGAR|nr:hypothetical protein DFH07DRAFT_772154 [Mycena maculata]
MTTKRCVPTRKESALATAEALVRLTRAARCPADGCGAEVDNALDGAVHARAGGVKRMRRGWRTTPMTAEREVVHSAQCGMMERGHWSGEAARGGGQDVRPGGQHQSWLEWMRERKRQMRTSARGRYAGPMATTLNVRERGPEVHNKEIFKQRGGRGPGPARKEEYKEHGRREAGAASESACCGGRACAPGVMP